MTNWVAPPLPYTLYCMWCPGSLQQFDCPIFGVCYKCTRCETRYPIDWPCEPIPGTGPAEKSS